MKYLPLTLIGFFSSLLAFSLFGSFSFLAIASIYSLSQYLLFYTKPTFSYPYLAGATLGLELLGTAHFGRASIISLITLFLYFGLGKQLRFTSPFFRYIVALFITLAAYTLFLSSLQTLGDRLLPMGIFYLVAVFISYLITYRNTTSDELL